MAKVGQTVTIDINIDTRTRNINAAEVYLRYDPKMIKVISAEKEGSFFQLWIPDEPKFSQKSGTISFAGGLPTPGLTGKGKIGSVKAKLIKRGETKIYFLQKSRMLLNDGKGTSTPLLMNPISVTIK